ncbi:MAG TPA: hypothetical protein VIL37_20830 [Natronosporangium sp.]
MSDGPPVTPSPEPDIKLVWFVVALLAYIAAGFFLKSAVLNWIVGPLFPFLALFVLPRLLRWRRGAAEVESAE